MSLHKLLQKLYITIVPKMSTFTQRLNPVTGSMDWVVQNEEYDYHQEVARSSYADMLHDTERNRKYEAALKIAIDHLHAKGRAANVLDIGTGTGLLSMLAARHGADTVVACEAFTPMSHCAEKIIKLNGFSNKIKVVPKRSTELTVGKGADLEVKPNILVTEVFDTELIGEGAINTFRKAHEDLLEKDCIVIPHSAVVYAQIVEGPLIRNWNLPNNISNNNQVLLKVPSIITQCPGAAAVHDIQMSQLSTEMFETIASPHVVFEFDWSGRTQLNYERKNMSTVEAETNGTAQAVFMWWELAMDINNDIILSCAPYWAHPDYKKIGKENIPWRDHWMQAVYYLPNEVNVKKGEQIHLISCHDEFSLWFDLKQDISAINELDCMSPYCNCNLHISYPRTRIGQLNDPIRNKKYVALFEKYVSRESVILILSHGFYHALIAAKLGAKKVVCIETNSLSRSLLRSFVEFNDLDNVEIIESAQDLHDLSDGCKFNLVFGEPYFKTNILPWDNLYFVYLLDKFRKFCDDNVRVLPKRGVIKGVAVEFLDLHKIRAQLGTCEGFKMGPFDELIKASSSISDENVEAQPLWEYPCRALSQIVAIADVCMENLSSEIIATTGTFNLEGNGNCNGIALWVDWIFDEEYSISTGPTAPITINENVKWDMHVRQGVHLINNRNFQGRINYTFSFQYETGDISFKIS